MAAITAAAALRAALAAEDAAIFGYGVAGAHLTGAGKTRPNRTGRHTTRLATP